MHAFAQHNALPSPSFSNIFSAKSGSGVRKKRLSIVRAGYNESQGRPMTSGEANIDPPGGDIINDGAAINSTFRTLHRAWSAGAESSSMEDVSRSSLNSINIGKRVDSHEEIGESQNSLGGKDEEEFLSAAEDD